MSTASIRSIALLLTAVGMSLSLVAWALAAPKPAAVAVAGPWLELANARLRLIAGPPLRPTDTYLAGVELNLADGWKTYWRMPGDAGVPPNFDWTGSRNLAFGSVFYPAPIRLVDPAATSIGYKGSVIFPVAIAARAVAQPVTLELALELGVCRDICIPAEGKLSLTIPPEAARGPPSATLLAAWQRVPRSAAVRRAGDPEFVSMTALLSPPAPHLLVVARFPSGNAGADLFIEPDAAQDLYLPLPRRLPDAADGSARFEVDLARLDAQALKGKSLRLTLVSDAAASEADWIVP